MTNNISASVSGCTNLLHVLKTLTVKGESENKDREILSRLGPARSGFLFSSFSSSSAAYSHGVGEVVYCWAKNKTFFSLKGPKWIHIWESGILWTVKILTNIWKVSMRRTFRKFTRWRYCLALCNEIFDHLPIFDETLRHIELCNSVIRHMHRNPPKAFLTVQTRHQEEAAGRGGGRGQCQNKFWDWFFHKVVSLPHCSGPSGNSVTEKIKTLIKMTNITVTDI